MTCSSQTDMAADVSKVLLSLPDSVLSVMCERPADCPKLSCRTRAVHAQNLLYIKKDLLIKISVGVRCRVREYSAVRSCPDLVDKEKADGCMQQAATYTAAAAAAGRLCVTVGSVF